MTAVESDFTDEELGLIQAEMERREEEIRNGRPLTDINKIVARKIAQKEKGTGNDFTIADLYHQSRKTG